jgi:hypothetical protein
MRFAAMVFAIATCGLGGSLALAGPIGASEPDPESLLERAESAYASALEASADRAAARALFAETAAAYGALVDAGYGTAAVQRNLGNALLASGELGEAIVAYRRSQRLDPHDERTRDALAAARASVRTSVEPGVRARLSGAVLWWRGVISRESLAWIGAGGWALAWLGLACGARGRALVVAGALAAVVGLGSLVVEDRLIASRNAVVVIEDGVVARVGPSAAVYDPAFTSEVREGVEGTAIERRDGWVRVRLVSGQQAWLPALSLDEI